MKAISVRAPGGTEHLLLGERPRPRPGTSDLLVRVHATALNRADLLQRQGKYPPPPGASDLLGLEVAGVVEEIGDGVTDWQVGDRVCGLLAGGGYAEYALLPAGHAMPLPENLSFEEGAAIPEVFLTAFQALDWIGQLQPGETVLIHAGASGVGTAAIQLARHIGATVLVTASAPKHNVCLDLGAHVAMDYRTEDFADRVEEVTGGKGANVIVDFIGAGYFEQNIRALARDGRIVLLATMGGTTVPEFDLRDFFRKRASLTASTLRNRSDAYKTRLVRAFREGGLPLFASGALRPLLDSVFDWTEVAEAHQRMENNENAGKIVLRVRSEP